MSSWAARMHRRAATFGNAVTSCGHPSTSGQRPPYPRRLEKVKFGVPLEEVCKDDIPGPLLVLILKLNKEAPYRKDVFRAPGHLGAIKKLTHFLQQGRLVNVANFSVYTIASVLKKFLRKLPGGVFGGREVEKDLFHVVEVNDHREQQEEIKRILTSLPVHTQRLLVLLFGTFRVIASNSEKHSTGMTAEALGVSVAPSFFHSCVSDGNTAKMEDVMKFKVASKVMKHLIEEFASSNLFGRDNYEYYARVTGRVLRVQGEWICSFRYPPPPPLPPANGGAFPANEYVALERYLLGQISMGKETWLHYDNYDHWNCNLEAMSQVDERQSSPAGLLQPQVSSTSLGIIAEHHQGLLESCTRLSVSLEQNGLFQGKTTTPHSTSSTTSPSSSRHSSNQTHQRMMMTLEELKAVNRYAESTRSLSYLPQVHERQTERMKTRSQWFLGPSVECTSCGGSLDLPLNEAALDVSALTDALLRRSSSGTIVGIAGLSLSAESIQKRPQSVKRSNSRYVQRGSASRRNKENGSRSNSFKRNTSSASKGSFKLKYNDNVSKSLKNSGGELCSCSKDGDGESAKSGPATASKMETICVTLKYKPRI